MYRIYTGILHDTTFLPSRVQSAKIDDLEPRLSSPCRRCILKMFPVSCSACAFKRLEEASPLVPERKHLMCKYLLHPNCIPNLPAFVRLICLGLPIFDSVCAIRIHLFAMYFRSCICMPFSEAIYDKPTMVASPAPIQSKLVTAQGPQNIPNYR